jgi:hypothetical protein
MISIKTKPENRAEIRRAVDIRCAEQGISRSTFAVKTLHVSPYILNFVLSGRTRHTGHPDIVAAVNALTGATDAAWEK